MSQVKNKRKQDKIIKKVKIVSLLASFLMLFAIADIIYFYSTDAASVIRETVIKVYNNS